MVGQGFTKCHLRRQIVGRNGFAVVAVIDSVCCVLRSLMVDNSVKYSTSKIRPHPAKGFDASARVDPEVDWSDGVKSIRMSPCERLCPTNLDPGGG